MKSIVARGGADPVRRLEEHFCGVLSAGILYDRSRCDAVFKDAAYQWVIGVNGLSAGAPVLQRMLGSGAVVRYLDAFGQNCSLLIHFCSGRARLFLYREGAVHEDRIPDDIETHIAGIRAESLHWAGRLNPEGEHAVALDSPAPGPHFNVNLLLGNRIGFSDPLQTTPKSVVDRFGGGSFRSHAATCVLAARWDMRAEENGFPANRQFYLLEAGEIIFYSGPGGHANIVAAGCTHGRNHTRIFYRTACGLEVKRLIFILPQKAGHPLAVESQRIEITNTGNIGRQLKLVYTGMFGTPASHALWEDVIYSNIIMQAKILRDHDGNLLAVGSDYYPAEFQKDHRFHSTFLHTSSGPRFPTQFSFDYTEFVGAGTLEKPAHAARLSNRLGRKGPGFFAVGIDLKAAGGQTLKLDNFTGLVSSPPDGRSGPDSYESEIAALLADHADPGQTQEDLAQVVSFIKAYSDCVRIQSEDPEFDIYFNHNLPFQLLYQTFVSRSFGQTQKGYREIGFREIQDLYASIYYFVGMGQRAAAKELMRQWIENVFEFGYANHNFFWNGKEPGKWSDDPLWLIQAVYRYIAITGEIRILDEEFEIAGSRPAKRRKLKETLCAVIDYCAEISIGRHGLPLIDSADWNDCLKIDEDFIDGPEKERRYYRQIAEGGTCGDPFVSDYSESVMNAFLLKHGLDLAAELFESNGDSHLQTQCTDLSAQLHQRIQTHAWKKDFFARVLLNRFDNGEYAYIGADGDGLSADTAVSGVYFLNSFSWSVLAGCATDQQVAAMLTAVENYLKTPCGLKLMTPAALDRIASQTATGHYFSGDRENGAVFKHAAMMAAAALFKASKQVGDGMLAQKTAALAYWMIDLVLPYKALLSPYQSGGNPRFCTQYINSETGEHIGPLLSGTSTWLFLALFSAGGIEFSSSQMILDPILRESQRRLQIRLNTGRASYDIRIRKPEGFFRMADSDVCLELDQEKVTGNGIPLFTDHKEHIVKLTLS